jgi:murein L,D-transpeptidase YcbB/YkuD
VHPAIRWSIEVGKVLKCRIVLSSSQSCIRGAPCPASCVARPLGDASDVRLPVRLDCRDMSRPIMRLCALALGLALAMSLGVATVMAADIPPDADTQVIARYVGEGGRLPDWARSRDVFAKLVDEADAHGVGQFERAPVAESAPTEVRTVAAALRLARMLASGAVTPQAVQRDWTIPAPTFAPESALSSLLSTNDPLSWLRSLAPRDPAYGRLQLALGHYRAIAQNGGWPSLPSAGPTLERGMTGERVLKLRQRLKIEGELASDAPDDGPFDAALHQAVRSFQARHGIFEDGRVGPQTLAALNLDAEQRYRQIAANLERWRWLPRSLPRTRVVINAAAARLALFEAGEPVLDLRTIVGKPRTPTPVLSATITSVLFNPPWDIPAKIARQELRPLARRDRSYFEREGIVEVGDGNRLRQLPGPKNALGRIKFEMPNPLDVYVHDTPSKELFQRPRRFFSHGCIRVEHPEILALHLLRSWTAETIGEAVASGVTRRVVVEPVEVLVVYFTAIAAPDGRVEFIDDIYHRDQTLIDALFGSPVSAARARSLVTECSHQHGAAG